MTEETHIEPTTFEVPVYCDVWKTGLEAYVNGDRDYISDGDVSLKVGTVPTDYNEFHSYMPVGVVTVKIPNKTQRIQTELLAIDVAIELEKERSLIRLEEMQERKQQLMALPHLPEET